MLVNKEDVATAILNSIAELEAEIACAGSLIKEAFQEKNSKLPANLVHKAVVRAFEGVSDVYVAGDDDRHHKDVRNIVDESLSIEVKTSKQPWRVANNRSTVTEEGSKKRDSFYVAVNYEVNGLNIDVRLIRAGYLVVNDWDLGKDGARGQIVTLSKKGERKLETLWSRDHVVIARLQKRLAS